MQHAYLFDTARGSGVHSLNLYVTYDKESRLSSFAGGGRPVGIYPCILAAFFFLLPCIGCMMDDDGRIDRFDMEAGARMHGRGSCCMNLTMLLAAINLVSCQHKMGAAARALSSSRQSYHSRWMDGWMGGLMITRGCGRGSHMHAAGRVWPAGPRRSEVPSSPSSSSSLARPPRSIATLN